MRNRAGPVHAIAVGFGLWLAQGCAQPEGGTLEATGTVEVVELDVAPTQAARVIRVWVEEGEGVEVGDTLVTLALPALPAELERRSARVEAAQALAREREAGSRAGEIGRAEAELDAAEAEAQRSARDRERLEALARQGAVSAQDLDSARAVARGAAGRRDSARETLRLLREGSRPEAIEAARAEVAAARAELEAERAVAADLVLVAPVEGLVLGRHAEPGEVLVAGEPALTLGELGRPWVRVFIPERSLPHMRLGQAATATLDGLEALEFPGRVIAIAGKAEFTPRIALTEEERADLVFAVKVALEDTTGTLKPGLPATVRFDR